MPFKSRKALNAEIELLKRALEERNEHVITLVMAADLNARLISTAEAAKMLSLHLKRLRALEEATRAR